MRGLAIAAALVVAMHAERAEAGPEPASRREEPAADEPRVWAACDLTRVRRRETGSPASRGTGNAIFRPGGPIRLGALRAEVVAFQVLVEAGAEPLHDVTVDVSLAFGPAGEPPRPTPAASAIAIDRFVEHYVVVDRRSRNEGRPEESLGWAPSARPPDERVWGELPDALIPVEAAPAWRPYPMQIEPRTNGAVWVDLRVAESAPPGSYAGAVTVRARDRGTVAELPLVVEVAEATLPFRAVSFLAAYGPEELSGRMGGGERVERQLWQLLHAHHVDAFGSLREPEDVARLRAALDGSLFTAAHGYDGPGVGVPPAAVALGLYGSLGEPTPEALGRVEAIARSLPPAAPDAVLYAVDEACSSPLGPGWRRLVASSPSLRGRVRVAHSCHEDPRGQDVDLALVPASAWSTEAALAVREAGRDAWIYGGFLPHAGPMLLDADAPSLAVNAWIAATRPVGRWFLWETTFWNDDNRGGRGPIDPFVVAESFHNADGDAALGDGLLVYPGVQRKPAGARSIGLEGVVPSVRLKVLRRGIQDAGYYALARAASPERADAIADDLLPLALDEVSRGAGAPFAADGEPYARARSALRALVPRGASLDPGIAARLLREGAIARRARRVAATRRTMRVLEALYVGGAFAIVLFGAARRARSSHSARLPR